MKCQWPERLSDNLKKMETMKTLPVEQQLAEINSKLDFLMEEISYQRQRRQETEDLMQDISLIGKDLSATAVERLDKAGIAIDYDQLTGFGIKLLRNIETFSRLLDLMESADDLLRDVGPILHQAGLDAINKLHELEAKGYFEFARELMALLDKIVTNFSAKDLHDLSENIVPLLETLKNIPQPGIAGALNQALKAYGNTVEQKEIPRYSLWKLMKELNSPEMKKGIGFIITFMKHMAVETNK